jgi:hypothetical protein
MDDTAPHHDNRMSFFDSSICNDPSNPYDITYWGGHHIRDAYDFLFGFFDTHFGCDSFDMICDGFGVDRRPRGTSPSGHWMMMMKYMISDERQTCLTFGYVLFMLEQRVGRAGVVSKTVDILYKADAQMGNRARTVVDDGAYARLYEERVAEKLARGQPVFYRTPNQNPRSYTALTLRIHLSNAVSESEVTRDDSIIPLSYYMREFPEAVGAMQTMADSDSSELLRHQASKVIAAYNMFHTDGDVDCLAVHELCI